MSFKKVEMFTVICDRCGLNAFEHTEFSGWCDKYQALDEAEGEDFVEIDSKHYCNDCWEWDSKDENQIARADIIKEGES